MTKKKRELIDILLDNVKPEDWPEIFPYAAQDKSCSMVYVYANIPYISSIYGDRWECGEFSFNGINIQVELCKFWNKTIVHRDEFMKRWDEWNAQNDNKPTSIGRITWNGKFIFEDFIEAPIDVKYCDDFINQWNKRINTETNTNQQPAQKEVSTEETKPIQQELKATDTQVGGDHYTKLAIQPMRYSMENGLDALQHTIIKYVTRFRDKAGIEDLEKAKHCIDMLIEFEIDKK